MISLRLDRKTENQVRDIARRYDVTVSEFIRTALDEKLRREANASSPFEAGTDLFGRFASGDTDRSEQVEARLRKKLRAAHDS